LLGARGWRASASYSIVIDLTDRNRRAVPARENNVTRGARCFSGATRLSSNCDSRAYRVP
jgi:hypothetical protein